MSDEKVYLIENSYGKDKCPDGKLALYTHGDYNIGYPAGILIIPPGIQLDEKQLTDYGFPVGERNGVSSLVNNIPTEITLIAGRYLDGETLAIPANKEIPTLTDYPLGSGNWQDSVQSVVSMPVKNINLGMTFETNVNLYVDEIYYAALTITNNSSIDVMNVIVKPTSLLPAVIGIDSQEIKADIPANNKTIIRIPLSGKKEGSSSIEFRIYTPIGIINNGDNLMTSGEINVLPTRDLKITQSYISHWKPVWDQPEYLYSFSFVLSSKSLDVKLWRLSFRLPEKAEVSPAWLDISKSWVVFNHELSKDGLVVLDSVEGNTILPEKDITLNIQIIFPGESEEYEYVQNLQLEQLA